MRIYLQWARANPVGWEPLDVTKTQDIRSLPQKGEPTAPFDPLAPDANDPGWLQAVNVQGVTILGFDHLAPRMNPTNPLLIDIVAWNDDPVDFPVGMRWGIAWSFANPRTDPRVGNRVNTEQYLAVWDEQGRPAGWYGESTTGGDVVYDTWANFDAPGPANMVRHGIWIDSDCENCPHPIEDHEVDPYKGQTGDLCQHDDCTGYASLHLRHLDALAATPHGWREWIG